MKSRNHILCIPLKLVVQEPFCSLSGSCHLPLIKTWYWGNGTVWHCASPARKTLSIWSDCNIHLAEHHVKDRLIDCFFLSYPTYITSLAPEIRRNSNETANPVRFKKTNCVFWNIFKAAMYLSISNEALSFVTKWKFLLKSKTLIFHWS